MEGKICEGLLNDTNVNLSILNIDFKRRVWTSGYFDNNGYNEQRLFMDVEPPKSDKLKIIYPGKKSARELLKTLIKGGYDCTVEMIGLPRIRIFKKNVPMSLK